MYSIVEIPNFDSPDVPQLFEDEPKVKGVVFRGNVPDFVSANPRVLLNCKSDPSQRKVTDGLVWAVHHAIIEQKCHYVSLSQKQCAQVVWGADKPPVNWRPAVVNALKEFCEKVSESKGEFFVSPNEQMTQFFDQYLVTDPDAGDMIDLRRHSPFRDPEAAKIIRQAWKERRHRSVYYPLELFGHSRRVGLSFPQVGMLRSLLAETTHPVKKQKGSKANDPEVIRNGMVPSPVGDAMIRCPFLEPGRSYVGFNGNGKKLHGKAYRLFGARGKGWMDRFGYGLSKLDSDHDGSYQCRLGQELIGPSDDEFVKDAVKMTKTVLAELTELASRFGLIVCAVYPGTEEWKGLSEMSGMLGSSRGRGWLNCCHLRVYTEADYLTRWRQYFAERLGFSKIPGGAEAKMPTEKDDLKHRLVKEMEKAEMCQKRLAGVVEMSPTSVSYYLAGKRPWSKEFTRKVKTWLDWRQAVEEEDTLIHSPPRPGKLT